MLLTGSIVKPVGFALASVPAELTTGIVYTTVGQVGETALIQ